MDLLTGISWTDPSMIIIAVVVVAVIAAAGYLWWAYSENNWPFGQ